MKKLIVCSSVAVLMLSTLNVYAGPKFKKIKNPKLGARVSRVTAETLRKGELRYAPEHTPRLSERAEHTTTAPSSTVQRPNLRDVQDGTISPRLPSGGNVQGVHVGTFRSTPELPYRNPADIPTRTQAAQAFEDAKARSKREQNPNILENAEVEFSFARHKRAQFSEQLSEQLEQLRAQDQSALSKEIRAYYVELREKELKRHSEARADIVKRQVEQEDPHAQYDYEPEMNRYLDELDRINEMEIAARETVSKNPDRFSTSFQQREAEIAKQRLYLADEKLELDWQKEMLEKKNAELIQRRKQFEEEEKGIVARMNTARDLRVNDVFEQGRVQRDYELLREKQSQLAAEFEQYQNEVESFNQSVEQYNTAVEQLNADWENFSIDRKILLKNPSEKSVEVIQSKKPL